MDALANTGIGAAVPPGLSFVQDRRISVNRGRHDVLVTGPCHSKQTEFSCRLGPSLNAGQQPAALTPALRPAEASGSQVLLVVQRRSRIRGARHHGADLDHSYGLWSVLHNGADRISVGHGLGD